MKTMKKLGVLALVLVMALSFAACSKDEGSSTSGGQTEVEKYVAENASALASGFEQGFVGSSGIDCDTKVTANGNDIIFTVCIDGYDNLSSSDKSTMQAAFDSMNSELKEAFSGVKTEIPSVKGLIINICEEDGDKIAKVEIDY